MNRKLDPRRRLCAAAFSLSALFNLSVATAATVTVVEFYNTALDAYFITGKTSEQSLLDGNSSFRRTGMSFAATSIDAAASTQSRVCRFYVSAASPFVSSHFYGGQTSANQTYDCEWLRANTPSGFSFEGYDFAVTTPVNGTCATGTSPVYRGFRALSALNNGKTSNHRYTTTQSSYASAEASGYAREGVQFCALAATDVTAATTTTAINCAHIQASTAAYGATVSVDCSATDYGKIASRGLPTHAMMNGITATNLQVPIAQKFVGANAWKIPLAPSIAATPTPVNDGPIGVAINGVPIFNPCKQGGCQNGDTKVLGELDVCNGHAGRADDYHYHAAPTCLMADQPAHYWDTHPLGWALDGFAIFGYNDASGTTATRDAICGGNMLTTANAPAGYSYHVTDTAPYVMSCLRGTPSPDLTGQGAKYTPFRVPPVTPFPVTNMTLSEAADGFQVLQFTSNRSFQTTETGTDSYANAAGSYRIRYKALTGTDLAALLAQAANANKTECWKFEFTTAAGTLTQPTTSYCR